MSTQSAMQRAAQRDVTCGQVAWAGVTWTCPLSATTRCRTPTNSLPLFSGSTDFTSTGACCVFRTLCQQSFADAAIRTYLLP
jgi:hypothetical protein